MSNENDKQFLFDLNTGIHNLFETLQLKHDLRSHLGLYKADILISQVNFWSYNISIITSKKYARKFKP